MVFKQYIKNNTCKTNNSFNKTTITIYEYLKF